MKPVLTLIRTSPPQSPGSMSAYAKLVRQALDADILFSQVRFCDLFAPFKGRTMWFHHLWRVIHARRLLKAANADLYHLMDGSMCAFVPPEFRRRTVVTLHDLIPVLQLDRELPGVPSLPASWLIRRSVSAMPDFAGMAGISRRTLQDAERKSGCSNGMVIPIPVRPLAGGKVNAHADLPERYLLHVGNNALYKNRSGVLDVFARLQDVADLHLIMAGPEPGRFLRRRARGLQRVQFLVNPPDGDLGDLYRGASAFLFPSLYEGFGMPVLEAMSAGCPVVCSDAGSLPEVAGGAALLAPAGDAEALASHCRAILDNPILREDLRSRGRRHAAPFNVERFSRDLRVWYCQSLARIGVAHEHP